MAAEEHLILEQALHRGIIYRKWAIGATVLAAAIVLALAAAIFFLLWQWDSSHNIAQARSGAEIARDEAEAAIKQSREAIQEAAGMAELAQRSLPIIAIGLLRGQTYLAYLRDPTATNSVRFVGQRLPE